MVGQALVEAGVCKDAGGAFAMGAAALLQGSLELVADVVGQAQGTLGYTVSTAWVLYKIVFFLPTSTRHVSRNKCKLGS